VNLAARLEQHTKEAKRTILMDAATRDTLPSSLAPDPLGAVTLRGKTQPVDVFAL
jgi:class 3 adenylate cyclase